MREIKQSTAVEPLIFYMTDEATGAGKTGLTPTVTISKNGAAFAAPAGAVSEIGNGFYKLAANATDSNTLGLLIIVATAAGAVMEPMAYSVVANLASDIYGRLGAPAGATVSADLAAHKAVSDAVKAKTDNLPAAPAATGDIPTAAAVRSEIDSNSTQLSALTGRLTTARAGYLDKLNVSGTLAHSDAADSYKANVAGLATAANLAIVDSVADGVKVVTDKLNTALELDSTVWRFTANALEQSPASGGGSATLEKQNEILTAVGTRLASASYTAPPTVSAIRTELDDNSTKLSYLSAELAKVPRAGLTFRWTNQGSGAGYDDVSLASL